MVAEIKYLVNLTRLLSLNFIHVKSSCLTFQLIYKVGGGRKVAEDIYVIHNLAGPHCGSFLVKQMESYSTGCTCRLWVWETVAKEAAARYS